MIRVEILEAPFDLAREVEAIALSGVGAVASFSGYVRGDGGIIAIELEHSPAMTVRVLTTLAEQASNRWSLSACTILHRVGRLAVGEPIVLVAVASPH
ncbi:MAG: molybdenum cofactor biosynthesis protein MoaE, partial [Sphingorhabdus sp.]